jgi:hypothetical protein
MIPAITRVSVDSRWILQLLGLIRRVDIRTSGCGSNKSRDSYWKIICDEDCSMLNFNFPFLYFNNSVSFVVLFCTPKSKSGKLKLLLLNQNTPS